MRVATHLPISLYFRESPVGGPKRMKMNLVGIGTSVMSGNKTPSLRRTKARIGFSRKSTSPISTLDASAPAGSFFKNYKTEDG